MALPVVTSIAPTSGPAGGGTIVTVTGTGLTGALAVGFGSADATNIVPASDTQVIAVSPPGSGTVNVTVVTPAGRSTTSLGAQFAYSAASATSGTYFIDPALTSSIVGSLVSLVQGAASADAQEAQNILLRRLALEGDVVGSRVPPPRNITEIGGYLNMLAALKESAMREQALAGILGVAGPSSPLGWVSNQQALAMVSLPNDRPAGPAQASIPLTVLARSDFSGALQDALKTLHQSGATLPFSGAPVIMLPLAKPGATPPADMLYYLGRTLTLATAAALSAPSSDPLALIRPAATTGAFSIAANVLSPGPTPVTPANYDALQCTQISSTVVSLSAASFVPIAPILAGAGFYPASPLPQPANNRDTAWARLTNVTGLTAGVTRLGDEFSLLYSPSTVAASVFAPLLNYVWNGTTFAAA
jgi:IPT/TIG domain-containing protein